MNKQDFRAWMVQQKFTLNRGYSWANIPMLGLVVATSIKTLLPGIFNTFWKTRLLVIFGLLFLWGIGYFDRRYHFLHKEQEYQTETNPTLMEVVNANREKKNETEPK